MPRSYHMTGGRGIRFLRVSRCLKLAHDVGRDDGFLTSKNTDILGWALKATTATLSRHYLYNVKLRSVME